MDKRVVAVELAAKLKTTEIAIDEAMFEVTKLLEASLQARRDLELPMFAGEVAQSRIVETVAAIAEAHRTIKAAHSSLADMGRKMGLETTMDLTTVDPPSSAQQPSDLRVAS